MIMMETVNLAGAPTPQCRQGERRGRWGADTGGHPVVLLPMGAYVGKECAQLLGIPRGLFTTTGWYQAYSQRLKWSFTDLLPLTYCHCVIPLGMPNGHPVFPTSTGWNESCFLSCHYLKEVTLDCPASPKHSSKDIPVIWPTQQFTLMRSQHTLIVPPSYFPFLSSLVQNHHNYFFFQLKSVTFLECQSLSLMSLTNIGWTVFQTPGT